MKSFIIDIDNEFDKLLKFITLYNSKSSLLATLTPSSSGTLLYLFAKVSNVSKYNKSVPPPLSVEPHFLFEVLSDKGISLSFIQKLLLAKSIASDISLHTILHPSSTAVSSSDQSNTLASTPGKTVAKSFLQ